MSGARLAWRGAAAPADELADLGRARAARRVAREEAGNGRRALPRPRRRLRPEAVLPLLRRARERVRRRRRRREPRRRAARAGRGAARSRTRASTSSSARRCSSTATTRPRRCASCGASRRPAGACSPRRTASRSTTPRRRTTGAGRTPGSGGCSSENAELGRRSRCAPAAGTATCLAMLLGTYVEIAFACARAAARRAAPSGCSTARPARSTGASSSLREPRPGSLTANFHVVATVGGLMRLFRRNVLGIYARLRGRDRLRARRHADRAPRDRGRRVRDLVVHRLDHDLPLRARPRRRPVDRPLRGGGARPASRRRTRTRSPRPGSCSTALIGLATLPIGLVLAWLVPVLVDDAGRPRLAGAHRDAARRPLDRRALPARPLQQPARRPAALRPPEPRQLRLDGALRGARGAPPAPTAAG